MKTLLFIFLFFISCGKNTVYDGSILPQFNTKFKNTVKSPGLVIDNYYRFNNFVVGNRSQVQRCHLNIDNPSIFRYSYSLISEENYLIVVTSGVGTAHLFLIYKKSENSTVVDTLDIAEINIGF